MNVTNSHIYLPLSDLDNDTAISSASLLFPNSFNKLPLNPAPAAIYLSLKISDTLQKSASLVSTVLINKCPTF